jgi:hypothetical protein
MIVGHHDGYQGPACARPADRWGNVGTDGLMTIRHGYKVRWFRLTDMPVAPSHRESPQTDAFPADKVKHTERLKRLKGQSDHPCSAARNPHIQMQLTSPHGATARACGA